MRKIAAPRRGDVYLVDFDPAVGCEIRKSRPALIVQNDVGNRYSPLVIVAAITSQFGGKIYPTEVPINAKDAGIGRDCVVLTNQIRTIDKQRLIKKIGKFDSSIMAKVGQALEISLGLIDL
ncbi:MAG: type II toxin-antitoxin system PemK/MazF family toxin [Candidatus Pacebacteria bacterium]|jgi:mRNA interferase MazF|nr:type II toxin-antitoxin system PemK/MazF family toxin [Candidatus Paceibacterota bacterium]